MGNHYMPPAQRRDWLTPDWQRFEAIVSQVQAASTRLHSVDIICGKARELLLSTRDPVGFAERYGLLLADVRYAQWSVKPRSERMGGW